jgi:hypothetical protein
MDALGADVTTLLNSLADGDQEAAASSSLLFTRNCVGWQLNIFDTSGRGTRCKRQHLCTRSI